MHIWYKLFIRICLFSASFLMSAALLANNNLYSDRVKTTDQTDAARTAAFASALTDVLIKVSGNPAIAQNPLIAKAIKQAPLWVQSYQYNSQHGLQLFVQFDPKQINQLLNTAKQSVWEGVRPRTLVWIVQNDTAPQFIGNNDQAALDDMSFYAQQRGLPLIYPLLDLQDLSDLSPLAVVNYQPPAIRQASARYPHDDILLVSVTPPAQAQLNWQASWSLLTADAKTDWQTQGPTLEATLQLGVYQYANTIFNLSKNVVAGPAEQKVSLTVYGITTLASYNQVYQYLAHTSGILSVNMVTLANDHVVFNLNLAESSAALNDFLSNSKILVPAEDNNLQKLVYRVYS